MAFGQEPRNTNLGNPQYNTADYNNQMNYAQPVQPQANYQYTQYTQGGAASVQMSAERQQEYAKAYHSSVTRSYGEMTIGLLVTAAVAIVTQMTGLYVSFIEATGIIGVFAPLVIEIVLAIALSARITKMKTSTARVMFYIYAALMGFSLSVIFAVYDLGTIGIALALCAGFFFALTMLGMTTKVDLLKAGPILSVGLIVLIIAEVLLMIFAPGQTTLMLISALGLVLFAGFTVYDAQQTRAIFAQYSGQDTEMIKKISILCALNLYIDFVNMFLYILQLLGDRD
ncbi:Inhibitor of apoptosis-promoting Bax1 [Bifidobacterium sp. DSM 109960]|uniref:Inhibitor of apoptosis-promoting Bax1 n=1 Tax=Bifidobacterium erythrocebi TaxID=2675325 RepID=A0A7Y0ET23_9BIFI|nr:Bax inhibitor-1/YccA family protein [Bifidobacterium sp. DSM 109960]NMM95905.1 Inhibitor of apoptosis-promoting Bax1 [Bifidobacterium sp. DSM 109960]